MKIAVLIIAIIFFSTPSTGQLNRLDSLIKQLNNSQVALGGNYVGATIHSRGEPSLSILRFRKDATEKLISVLDDTAKGIVAHIILSEIWERTELPKTILIERDTLTVFTYNNLNFFVRPGEIYTNAYDLKNNKRQWRSFVDKYWLNLMRQPQ